MIVSHKKRFIFLKTAKTAGSSIEVFLDPHCGSDDILTSFSKPEHGHNPRNHRAGFDVKGVVSKIRGQGIGCVSRRSFWTDLVRGRKGFYNHMSWSEVRLQLGGNIFEEYFKFCVVRNPYEVFRSGYQWHLERSAEKYDLNTFISKVESLKAAHKQGKGGKPYNLPIYADVNKRFMLDEVVFFESLNDGLRGIFKGLDVPFDKLSAAAKKTDKRMDLEPTRDQAARILSVYRDEADTWGYNAPDWLSQ